MMRQQNSEKLFHIAEEVFPEKPGGSSVQMDDCVVRRAKGAYFWDQDGHQFTDYWLSGGDLILGHADRNTVLSAKKHAERGLHFGALSRAQVDLAQYLLNAMPLAQKINFANSGGDAVRQAVRLARRATGRNTAIVAEGGCCSGCHISQENRIDLRCYDGQALQDCFLRYGHDIACIVIPPVAVAGGVRTASREYLEIARKLTRDHSAVLISDEVVSAFRAGPGSPLMFDVVPDIRCWGGIIGGGFPLGVYGGRSDLFALEERGYCSPVVLRAGMAALRRLHEGVYAKLNRTAEHFVRQVNFFFEQETIPYRLTQYYSILKFVRWDYEKSKAAGPFDREEYRVLRHFLYERGLYFPVHEDSVFFLSAAHSKRDVEKLFSKFKDFFFRKKRGE